MTKRHMAVVFEINKDVLRKREYVFFPSRWQNEVQQVDAKGRSV